MSEKDDVLAMSQDEYESWTLDESPDSNHSGKQSAAKIRTDARLGRSQYADRSAKECRRATHRR